MVKKMASKTEIFNEVVLSLGVTPDIQDADTDTGSNALAIKAAWNTAIQTVLRDHPWGFANKRALLALVGTAPNDWKYQYLYPTDCVKAIEIEKANRTDAPIPYKISQYTDTDNGTVKVILTDQDVATLIYTKNESDPSMFDAQFIKCLVAYLSYRCAAVITTAKDATDKAWNAYQRAKFEAMSSDGNEQIPDNPRDADWITGRN
jgi:hypothetical protein